MVNWQSALPVIGVVVYEAPVQRLCAGRRDAPVQRSCAVCSLSSLRHSRGRRRSFVQARRSVARRVRSLLLRKEGQGVLFVARGLMERVRGENGGERRAGEEIGRRRGGGRDERGEDYYERRKRSREESNGSRGGAGCREVKRSSGEMRSISRSRSRSRGREREWERERAGKGGEDGERRGEWRGRSADGDSERDEKRRRYHREFATRDHRGGRENGRERVWIGSRDCDRRPRVESRPCRDRREQRGQRGERKEKDVVSSEKVGAMNGQVVEEKEGEEKARTYQLEVLAQAKVKNTIAFLETGAGKTLIAVLLMKEKHKLLRERHIRMLAVFLVPKVPLVYQVLEMKFAAKCIHFF